MKIVIETIPHNQHRYRTVGDYWRDEAGTLQIRCSKTSDPRDALLVIIHEIVEVILCEHRGISEESITAFDKSVCDDAASPYVDDPGHSPAAPYHKEHVFAEIIERLMAKELERNWQVHDTALGALDDESLRP